MNLAYQQVIDVLTTETVDYKKIAIQLAKVDPDLFLQFHGKINVTQWMKDVIQSMKSGEKVEAIRTLRGATGISLKDAKDICDNLQDHLASKGYGAYYTGLNYDRSVILSDTNKNILDKLISAV